MATRPKIWLAGMLLSFLVTSGLCLDESSRKLVVPLLLIALGMMLWFAAVGSIRSFDVKCNRPISPQELRPADGIVEVALASGIVGQPNSIHSDFRRFTADSNAFSDSPNLAERSIYLLGRVVIHSVFVGRDGRGWSDQEIARGLASIRSAAHWIELEATRYGAPVNLSLAEIYFSLVDDRDDLVELSFQPEGDDFGPIEANSSTKAVAMASWIASKLGFADAADWMAKINSRYEADASAWLFHLRYAGRSMAIGTDLSSMLGVEFAVCYARESSFPEPLVGRPRIDPTTVAHEMLHQFGASDKYGVTLSSFPNHSVTHGEIMRLSFGSLSRMSIGPLTAEEIGWDGYNWLKVTMKNPADHLNNRRPTEG